jgi:predicted dehydrogenase
MVILIIGLGSISKKHIQAIRSICNNPIFFALRSGNSNIEVEGVTSISNMNELESMPDFAIISNPTNMHFTTIEMVLEYRIPIFVEKPALHTIDGSENLIKKINEYNTFNYVACNLRFHPCIIYLKNHLSSMKKRINEVNVYCGSYMPSWRPGIDFKKNYSANKIMGGGVHLDLFHELDYTYWIFGQPIKYKSFFSNKSSLGIDVIDYANYILEYKQFCVSIILNYYRKDNKRTIEIVFDDDTWNIDLLSSNIYNKDGHLLFSTVDFSIINTYNDQMKYFIDHLQNKEIPMNSFAESINILKIAITNE